MQRNSFIRSYHGGLEFDPNESKAIWKSYDNSVALGIKLRTITCVLIMKYQK